MSVFIDTEGLAVADRDVVEQWLAELTNIPTASGLEDGVVGWVRAWADERDDVELSLDTGGNVILTQAGDHEPAPVLAVAHMDHPAFVILGDDGSFEFRGGVDAPYFVEAAIEVVSRADGPSGTVKAYDDEAHVGEAEFDGPVGPGDIAMWRFEDRPSADGLFRAPACDDLAGAAAALAALDRARSNPELGHFGVLLTRAEEVGLIGAIHAAKNRTLPERVRLLSIETSRELPNARIGEGPVIRIGDRVTVFDREMSNRISRAAEQAGITHQRRLMDGGTCEATAFGVYGLRATGLCLALGNWHNRGNLAAVEAGDTSAAKAMLEEISLDDFHGLVELLLMAARAVDSEDPIAEGLDRRYESHSRYLIP